MNLIKGALITLVALFGTVCLGNTVGYKDLVCPDWPPNYSFFPRGNHTCNRSSDCPGLKLCCSDGADKHCTDPVPAYISKPVCQYTSITEEQCKAKNFDIYRRCKSDRDCSHFETCCAIETCQWQCESKIVQRYGENPVVTKSFKIKKSSNGKRTAFMHCSAVGRDLKTITWYNRNDEPLHHANIVTNRSPDGRKINSTLIVPIISCQTSLWYKCAAKTDHGRRSEAEIYTFACYRN